MTFTKHAIQRFRERITYESWDVVQFFMKSDIKNSTFLSRVDDIEKRICNGIVYVLDCANPSNIKVITLYLIKQ